MYLLQAPQVREFTLYSSMPAPFRRLKRSDWADANRSGVPVDSFLEGPVFDTQGRLYVCDIPWGRVFRVEGAHWQLLAEYDGEPNGLAFLDANTLLIADYKNGLMQLDVASGHVSPFLQRRNSERFRGVNDLIFDTRGNLYFTDQGQSGLHDPSGRLYRLRPDGHLDLLLHNIPSPNGLTLSPDEKVLYLAVTRGNGVWRVPLMADGSVTKVSQFFTSHGPSGPDGLTMDESGRLFVANPGLGRVWVLNHLAEPDEVLLGTRGASLTNVAFAGADGKQLFCTDSTHGAVLICDMPIAGQPVHLGRHQGRVREQFREK